MKNTYTTTIRFGIMSLAIFLASTGMVFAAPVLSPATATAVTETTATFTSKVLNSGWKTTTVWFEYGETQNLGEQIGLREIFNEGFFTGYAYNLKPDTTYYFRAVGVEAGATVYSSTLTFKTRGGIEPVVVKTTINTSSSNSNNTSATPSSTNNTSSNTTTNNTTTKNTTVTKSSTDTNNDATKNVVTTNSNSASALGAGQGILPTTLVGWITLFIALFIIFILWMMILESIDERNYAREQARKERELEEKLNG